jgi:hypothetical protein
MANPFDRCQCEHVAHFIPEVGTPADKPGHTYGDDFAVADLVVIPSPLGGHILVCRECAQDCHRVNLDTLGVGI